MCSASLRKPQYNLILLGASQATERALAYAMLHCGDSSVSRRKEAERITRCETESARYTFFERSEASPDALLKEASLLHGAVLLLRDTDTLTLRLKTHLGLLREIFCDRPYVPWSGLRAVMRSDTQKLPDDLLDRWEQELREQLCELGFPANDLPLLRYDSLSHSDAAKRLLESLELQSAGVAQHEPSLRLLLHRRQRTDEHGIVYQLGSLLRGRIECGQRVEVVSYRERRSAHVHSLYYDRGSSIMAESIEAGSGPVDIWFALNEISARALQPGQLVTTPNSFTAETRHRALLVLDENSHHALSSGELSVGARWAPSYEKAVLRLTLPRELTPGGYTLATISAENFGSPLAIEPETHFTWHTLREKENVQGSGFVLHGGTTNER